MAILRVRKPDGTVQEIQTIVGPRGLKGVQGEKGEPGSNANVTNESVVAALGYTPADSADITDLKQLKPGESPVEGKLLKVKTVNDDGSFVCEWADAPAGSSTDVQIDGTSITSDGVANIPKAISGGSLGLIKIGASTTGLSISSTSGNLYVNYASDTAINNRASGNYPIVPKNLVTAVDSVLCSTAESEALTATEQAAARTRIGAASAATVSEQSEEIANLKNTGETTVASGKVWTSSADGAGWADPSSSGTVKSVNNIQPDSNGNVTVPTASSTEIGTAVNAYLTEHPIQAYDETKLNEYVFVRKAITGWDDVTIEYTNAYMTANGGHVANPSWKITDFIPVSTGDVFNYKLKGYSNVVTLMCAFNADKAVVDRVTGSSSQITGSYTVPDGVKYLKFCGSNSGNDTIDSNGGKVLYANIESSYKAADDNLQSQITSNADAIEDVNENFGDYPMLRANFTKTINLIETEIGEKASNYGATYWFTGYVPVQENHNYTMWCSTGVYQMHVYDSDKVKTATVTIGSGAGFFTTPAGAKYVRFLYQAEGQNIMLSEPFSGSYVPYGVIPKPSVLPEYIERSTNNLLANDRYSYGLYIYNGGLNASPGHKVYDYLPVSTDKTYNFAGINGVLVCGSDKSILRQISYESTYTPSDGDAYILVAGPGNSIQCVWCDAADSSFTIDRTYRKCYLYDTFKLSNVLPSDYERNNGLCGKKWLAIGDSITEGSGTTKAYHTYISERTGCFNVNGGMSNTAIARRGTSYTNDICIRYADYDDDFDIITVFAGTNDHGNNIPIGAYGDDTVDTLYGAMKILCEGLLTKYLGKKIGFILPLPKVNAIKNGTETADYSYPNEAFGAYIECIRDVCARYSIPVLDLYKGSGLAPKIDAVKTALMPDGLHPNAAGHELISFKIQRFLETL